METLGYGTHLTVDGFAAQQGLENSQMVTDFLREVARGLEPTAALEPEVYVSKNEPDGVSAVLGLSESHLSLHTFPHLETVTLKVFSRHSFDLNAVTEPLTRTFAVGRFESHVNGRARTVSKDSETRRRALLGDRSYAAARLGESLRSDALL